MEFPKDDRALDELFKRGTAPAPEEFAGEYWVDILTGPVPSFRWAGHKKRFYRENGSRVGKNLVLCNVPFGHFLVGKGVCDDLGGLPVAVLDYGLKRNVLTRNMRDRLRKVEDGTYLGRYCTQEKESVVFRGYFSLVRREMKK